MQSMRDKSKFHHVELEPKFRDNVKPYLSNHNLQYKPVQEKEISQPDS